MRKAITIPLIDNLDKFGWSFPRNSDLITLTANVCVYSYYTSGHMSSVNKYCAIVPPFATRLIANPAAATT